MPDTDQTSPTGPEPGKNTDTAIWAGRGVQYPTRTSLELPGTGELTHRLNQESDRAEAQSRLHGQVRSKVFLRHDTGTADCKEVVAWEEGMSWFREVETWPWNTAGLAQAGQWAVQHKAVDNLGSPITSPDALQIHADAALYDRRKDPRCDRCGRGPASPGHTLCAPCRVQDRQTQHAEAAAVAAGRPRPTNCRLCRADGLLNWVTGQCHRCDNERSLYDGQPFQDWKGIPDTASQDPCPSCGNPMRAVGGTQHFDADGGGSVDTRCQDCGIESGYSWTWSTGKPPAEDDDPEDPDDSTPPVPHQRTAGPVVPELNYDRVVQLHDELHAALNRQAEQCSILYGHLNRSAEALDELNEDRVVLAEYADDLIQQMTIAQFDTASIARLTDATTQTRTPIVLDLLSAVEEGQKALRWVRARADGAANRVHHSRQHVIDVYGEAAATVQATGVDATVLQATGS